MEQELIYKKIAVIGCGASGGLVSLLLAKNPYNIVTSFDIKEPFSTLLPTGGGRCNITYAENDIRDFVKNYPRGEKFLLSVFSKFDQSKTRQLFKDLGIKTYVQDDKRVFPISNSSAKTIQTLKEHLKVSNFNLKKEKVIEIRQNKNEFEIKTENAIYKFDYVILAAGGRGNGFKLAKRLGHKIIETKPSLCALDIREKNFYKLSGLSFSNAIITTKINNKKIEVDGGLLFAHKFITGPAVFKISALTAYEKFNEQNPLEINVKITEYTQDEIESVIKNNTKKSIKNVFSKFTSESYISEMLSINKIDGSKQIAQLRKQEKEVLLKALFGLKLNVIKRIPDSEIVTAGGIDLNEVNSKTMESKIVKNLYCIGEILNIDGYTGGFNLQNCWSCAYICSLNFN